MSTTPPSDETEEQSAADQAAPSGPKIASDGDVEDRLETEVDLEVDGGEDDRFLLEAEAIDDKAAFDDETAIDPVDGLDSVAAADFPGLSQDAQDRPDWSSLAFDELGDDDESDGALSEGWDDWDALDEDELPPIELSERESGDDLLQDFSDEDALSPEEIARIRARRSASVVAAELDVSSMAERDELVERLALEFQGFPYRSTREAVLRLVPELAHPRELLSCFTLKRIWRQERRFWIVRRPFATDGWSARPEGRNQMSWPLALGLVRAFPDLDPEDLLSTLYDEWTSSPVWQEGSDDFATFLRERVEEEPINVPLSTEESPGTDQELLRMNLRELHCPPIIGFPDRQGVELSPGAVPHG
ncbi:hypothetical protein DDZ18_10545 [Marinicauda salina]|uniref:Uncharacterized protein n=2 Tax=Marinicauda salina TaxID=2135793 RepID=A0A2U2BSY9_9PROT|nr:hypothetical protein DDZ18_10545 [Marinicauda salina]